MRKKVMLSVAGPAFIAVIVIVWWQQSPAPSDDYLPTLGLCQRLSAGEAGPNLFSNPSFEDADSWFSLKPPVFTVSNEFAHSGKASALLQILEPSDAKGTSIRYLVQEVNPSEFPEVISGYYRVENWDKNTPKQYVQFVVIVVGANNMPMNSTNHQIRYILAGIEEPPFAIANAKFVFLGSEAPIIGQWLSFERNLRMDFQQLWGTVPTGYDCLRFLFEVRYDDKVSGDGTVAADVFYDDLYLGPFQARKQ
jgi:hypothetical protein